MKHRAVAFLRALTALVLFPGLAQAGGLTFLQAAPSPERPTRVVITGDGLNLYTTNSHTHTDTLTAWGRDNGSGNVGPIESYTDPSIDDPTSVAASPDGLNVYVTSRTGGLAVFTRDPGTGELTLIQVRAEGDGDVPSVPVGTMGRPSSVVVSPDDLHVYVASEQDSSISLFERDLVMISPTYLQLVYVGMLENDCPTVCGLRAPEALAIAPDGLSLYAAAKNATTGAIAAFARDPGTGFLTFLEAKENNTSGITALLKPVALAVSPDNGALYTVSTLGDAAHVFSRNTTPLSPDYGKLTFVEVVQLGSKSSPTGIAIDPSPTGPFAYIVTNNAEAIHAFRRNASTSKLLLLQTLRHASIDSPEDIVVSPDGKFAHVSSARVSIVGTGIATFAVDTCGNGTRASDEECDSTPGCTASCELAICGPAPQTGCTTIVHVTTAENSSLDIKNDPSKADVKDQLKWQWKKGQTLATDFGDPRSTADYVICVYDGSANPQPLVSRAAPRGIWKRVPSNEDKAVTGFTYADKRLPPAGLYQFKLKSGLVDKAQLSVQGKGDFVRPPLLPLTLPVTVEVRSNQNPGVCWVATYGTNPLMFPKRITQHDGLRFKAKSD